MRQLLRLLCIAAIVAIGTGAAFAHEVLTHQKIGDAAVAYLQSLDPTKVLPNIDTFLRVGAVHEDDGPPLFTIPIFGTQPLRPIFHFSPALSILGASCSAID